MSRTGRESPSREGAVSDGWLIDSHERRVITAVIPCGPGPPGAPSSVTARARYDTFLRRA
jgi:hypothetical protein